MTGAIKLSILGISNLMQMYGNFVGRSPSKCIVWVGMTNDPWVWLSTYFHVLLVNQIGVVVDLVIGPCMEIED